MLLKKSLQFGLRRRAYNLFDNCAVLEQDERWNAAHAKSRRRGWMLFNIDFRDLHALISLRKFFKNGGDLLAGSAPLRPEIQQNGLLAWSTSLSKEASLTVLTALCSLIVFRFFTRKQMRSIYHNTSIQYIKNALKGMAHAER